MPDLTVRPEQEPELSEKAQREAVLIADRTLVRDESVKTHIHIAGLVVLWSVTMGCLSLAAIWVWHLASPDKWHFLSVEQLKDVQTVLLSAVGSSFATQAGKRWMNPRGDERDG
jgi:hypothetical protein